MSPFNFFKKKDKDISKTDNKIVNKSKSSSHHPDNTITIEFALEEIKKKENNIIKNHLDKLRKICKETIQSFEIINNIAESIESQKIDEEEEKLTPLINNTRNIIVKSLKRESSNTLQIPETFEELEKFKETIDSSIKRFGEVTRSHSIVINNFMKKHANSLRSELKKITENSVKINEYFVEILKEKEIIEECKNNLLITINKCAEINNNNSIIESINQNIKEKENENNQKEKEIKQLQELPSYNKSLDHLKEIEELEKNQEELIHSIIEISTQLTKAAHKYSYGTSKGTKETITTIIKDPIKIINDDDILPYIEFLNNLKESIHTKKIVLKDSTKITQYCDKMIDTIPKFKKEMEEIILKVKSLKKEDKSSTLERIRKIEEIIYENNKNIQTEILRREEVHKLKVQEEERSKQIINKIEEQLFHICKKKYKIDLVEQNKNKLDL
jgi:hypothetical protein